jgi:DNA-binding PadR family transcriptional regulator
VQDIELTLKMARLLNPFLADPARPRYGMELMQATELPSGSLYPMLAKFTQAGWLTRTKEDIDPRAEGRPRRYLYTLTAEALPVARERLAAIGAEFGGGS